MYHGHLCESVMVSRAVMVYTGPSRGLQYWRKSYRTEKPDICLHIEFSQGSVLVRSQASSCRKLSIHHTQKHDSQCLQCWLMHPCKISDGRSTCRFTKTSALLHPRLHMYSFTSPSLLGPHSLMGCQYWAWSQRSLHPVFCQCQPPMQALSQQPTQLSRYHPSPPDCRKAAATLPCLT